MTQALPIISPSNMLPVQVIRREVISSDVVSIYLVLPGTEQAPTPYLPGQFITIMLPTSRESLYRSYSLCGNGSTDEPWQIAVKRLEMGAVSTYFYNSVQAGMLLYATLPRGTFTLPARVTPEEPLIFVAVGSGITPILGMLRAIEQMAPNQRPLVQLHYASRTVDDILFADEFNDMDPDENWLQQFHYLSSRNNRMTAEKIIDVAGRSAQRAKWYICGPESLKHDIQKDLTAIGVSQDHIHTEVFATQNGPAYRVAQRDGVNLGGNLQIVETGATLDASPRETLLVALERHGYRPAFSCRVGSCGACKLQVIDGEVEPVGEILSQNEREDGYVLSCIAHPIGDVTLASGGTPPAGVARVNRIGSGGAPSRQATVVRLRVASMFALAGLLLGAWSLTNHKPASWENAAAQPPPTATPNPTNSGSATAVPGVLGVPGATAIPGVPTATPQPGAPTATPVKSTGPTPTPVPGATATPKPAPTATPKPAPTATSTPSPKQ